MIDTFAKWKKRPTARFGNSVNQGEIRCGLEIGNWKLNEKRTKAEATTKKYILPIKVILKFILFLINCKSNKIGIF